MKTKSVIKNFFFAPVLLMVIGLQAKPFISRAQNLHFNRVVIVSSEQTVPTGKVWKVESVLSNKSTSVYSWVYIAGSVNSVSFPSSYTSILVNGFTIYMDYGVGVQGTLQTNNDIAGDSDHSTPTKLPLWLPEDTRLAAGTGVNCISVMEFIAGP